MLQLLLFSLSHGSHGHAADIYARPIGSHEKLICSVHLYRTEIVTLSYHKLGYVCSMLDACMCCFSISIAIHLNFEFGCDPNE